MSVRKVKEIKKTPQMKSRGRACRKSSTNTVRDCHPPLSAATEVINAKPESPEVPGSQVPEAMEHPRTPVPWARRKTKRLRQDPTAGEGRASSLLTTMKVCKETQSSAAAAGGGGDNQSWQREDIPPVKKKAKTLTLNKQPDQAHPPDLLENFLSQFLTYLQECPDRPYFSDIKEPALGSTYDYEKFLHPGEFEVLLSISVPEPIQYTEVEGYGGLFYTLTLPRKSRNFPAALLLEDGKTISPRNVMEEFWQHVDQFAKVYCSVPFPGWQVKLEKKKLNCPSVNLVILDNNSTKVMSVNLIPALEMAGQWPCMKKAKELLVEKEVQHLMKVFYFIAQQSPGRHNKETWRISFFHVEKEILNRHSSSQVCFRYHKVECCRKVCLQMLEDVVDALKMEYPQMLAYLSSYHTRTSFLHTLCEWKTDVEWKPSDAAPCFERVLTNFIHEVATANLAHFFLPKCNLFGAKFFPPTKLKFLWSHLKEKEGAEKTSSVPQKRDCCSLVINPDLTWPLMITLGFVGLISVFLPHMVM